MSSRWPQPLSSSQGCVPGAASGSRDSSWMLVLRTGTWCGASSRPGPGLGFTGSHFPSKTSSHRPLHPSCVSCDRGPVSIPWRTSVQAAVFSEVGLPCALLFSVWSVSLGGWEGLGLKHVGAGLSELRVPVRAAESDRGLCCFQSELVRKSRDRRSLALDFLTCKIRVTLVQNTFKTAVDEEGVFFLT